MRERRGEPEHTRGYARDRDSSAGGSGGRPAPSSPAEHADAARGLITEMHDALRRAREAVDAFADVGEDLAAHRRARAGIEGSLRQADSALEQARARARLAGDPVLRVEIEAAGTAARVERIAVEGRLPPEPQPFRAVSAEPDILAILDADYRELGAHDGFARKDQQLRAVFDGLAPEESAVLRARLTGPPAPNDRLALSFYGQFTPERQSALRAYLGGARARQALRRFLGVEAAAPATGPSPAGSDVADVGPANAERPAPALMPAPAPATAAPAAAGDPSQRAEVDGFLAGLGDAWTVSPRPFLLAGSLEQRAITIDARAPSPPLGSPPVSVVWSVMHAEQADPVAQGATTWPALVPLAPIVADAVWREGSYQVLLAVTVEGHATKHESLSFTARVASKDAARGLADSDVMQDRADLRYRLATEQDPAQRGTLTEGYHALLALSAERGLPTVEHEHWRDGTATAGASSAPSDPAGARAYVEGVVAREGFRNGRVPLTFGAWALGDVEQQRTLMVQAAAVEAEASAFRETFRSETLTVTQSLLNQSERQLAQALHAYGLAPFTSAIATAARTVAHDGDTLDLQAEHLLQTAKIGRDEGQGYVAHAEDRAQLAAVARALAARQEQVRAVAAERAHLLTMHDETRFAASGGAGPSVARSHATHHAPRARMAEQLAQLPPPGPLVTLRGATPAAAVAGASGDQEQLVAAHLAASGAELARVQGALRAEWMAAERAHPILVAYRAPDGGPADLAALQGGDDAAMRAVLRDVLPKLGNIYKCEAWLAGGRLDPLTLAPAVALASRRLDVAPGSIRDAVVRGLVEDANDDGWQAWALAAVTLAMAVVAIVPTGGASVAVGLELAGLALDAYLAIEAADDYATDSATANTAMDPALALAHEEPSLAWLAVQLAGGAAGAGFAVSTFREAVAVRRAVLAGDSAQAAIRALDELGEREGLGAIGSRVAKGAGDDLGMAAGRAGGRELVHTSDVLGGVAASNPDALARRLGAGVEVDPALGSGVRVDRVVTEGGEVWILGLRIGPAASTADVLAHQRTIDLLRRYNGTLGRVRALFDRVTGGPLGHGAAHAATDAGHAGLEAEKLLRLVGIRQAALARQPLAEVADALSEELRFLDQLGEEFSVTVRTADADIIRTGGRAVGSPDLLGRRRHLEHDPAKLDALDAEALGTRQALDVQDPSGAEFIAARRAERRAANPPDSLINGPRSASPYAAHIPPVGGEEFNEWFDALTMSELRTMTEDPLSRAILDGSVREPGGLHEWLMVAEMERIKSWGVSIRTVLAARTPTAATVGKWFRHGGEGSRGTTFHRRLRSMITSSSDYGEFLTKLNHWADANIAASHSVRWPDAAPLGRYALPEELQLRGEGGLQ
jgi:hypothetical protein